MTAEELPRLFAAAFAAQDADALAAMIAPEGTALTLTGGWAENRTEARACFAAEFAGIFAAARLVTGKGTLQVLGHGLALLRQRFVVTGSQDENGAELPRFGAMLVAVLQTNGTATQIISFSFTALGQ